jgi:hypothetical protein
MLLPSLVLLKVAPLENLCFRNRAMIHMTCIVTRLNIDLGILESSTNLVDLDTLSSLIKIEVPTSHIPETLVLE